MSATGAPTTREVGLPHSSVAFWFRVQPAKRRVVEQGSGAPIAGALVILLRRLEGPPAIPPIRPPPMTMAGDGRFAFADVALGNDAVNAYE